MLSAERKKLELVHHLRKLVRHRNALRSLDSGLDESPSPDGPTEQSTALSTSATAIHAVSEVILAEGGNRRQSSCKLPAAQRAATPLCKVKQGLREFVQSGGVSSSDSGGVRLGSDLETRIANVLAQMEERLSREISAIQSRNEQQERLLLRVLACIPPSGTSKQ